MTLIEQSPKSIKIWTTDIKKVYLGNTLVRPIIRCLCFTANTANSTVAINDYWTPTAVSLETSPDGTTWTDYTFWTNKTLTNVWDKIYFRNKSTTTTWFSINTSNYYQFSMSWSIAASGDVTYLINKNWTDTITTNNCFFRLFYGCSALTTPPELPATTLTYQCYRLMFYNCINLTKAPSLPATTLPSDWFCYYNMFTNCSNLEELPELPATTLTEYCYYSMFEYCSKIKLSTTQTWEYQTPYRIPTVWTWTNASYALWYMFNKTWWTFKWAPSINTTYYTSNTVV